MVREEWWTLRAWNQWSVKSERLQHIEQRAVSVGAGAGLAQADEKHEAGCDEPEREHDKGARAKALQQQSAQQLSRFGLGRGRLFRFCAFGARVAIVSPS